MSLSSIFYNCVFKSLLSLEFQSKIKMNALKTKLLYSSVVALSLIPHLVAAYICTGVYATLASDFVSYQPARSYCSAKFPVPTATSTLIESTVTSTKTVSAATSLSTTDILTTITATSTYYVTSTQTDIVTFGSLPITSTETIIVPPVKKRSAGVLVRNAKISKKISTTSSTTTRDAKASAFSSLVAEAQAFIGSVCTCIEGQATKVTTSTPLATKLVTYTTTITTSLTVFATSYTSVTSSIVLTTTSTTISSASPPVSTDCSVAQTNACGGCFCSIDTISKASVCSDQLECNESVDGNIDTCQFDVDCVIMGQGTKCVYSGIYGEYICPGGTVCAHTDTCPQPNARRQLETVFSRERRGKSGGTLQIRKRSIKV